MKAGPLWKVAVAMAAEAEDAVVELLGGLFGQPASVYSDVETGETSATVYLQKKSAWSVRRRAALAAGLKRIAACGLDLGPGRISMRRVRREDWAESWKRHFRPMEIGGALLIKPSWSRRRAKPHQAVVVLDPGLSFGTGQHPTTRFCLEQIVACRQRDTAQTFLDIGTGSGILAIAAGKLGYCPVEGFDFDAEAVRIAKANARQNAVTVRLARRDLTGLPAGVVRPYDVVCANLIYDLLLAEWSRLLSRLQRNGTLVLAGILESQFEAVRQCYENAGCKLVAARTEKEWRSGAFRRVD